MQIVKYKFVSLGGFRALAQTLHMKRNKNSSAASGAKKKPKKNESSGSDEETTVTIATEKKTKPSYNNFEQFLSHMQAQRIAAARDVHDFAFKKKRVRVLSTVSDVKEQSKGGVLYWMSRDARVQDNWALLFAQRLALKLELPLTVVFCLVPKFLNATLRHYKFMLGGLQEVEQQCHELNISFQLLLGPAAERLPEFVTAEDIGAVICDFAPLRLPRQWVGDVVKALPGHVPLTQVDAHNIVPLWVTSEKQEYAARTIRNKINSKLGEFLSEFPPVIRHPHGKGQAKESTDWTAAYALLSCDKTVDAVDWAKPGYTAGCRQLYEFCTRRLRHFNEKRNDPTADALSGLSPWLHFGQISAQRCILEVQRYSAMHKASADAKKILEWTETPELALEYSILLNDKYSLDGRDPNGYVGCMWSIGGVHDQGWKERDIFGKIRYMNYQGCKRKFDINAFVMRYGRKVHQKKEN